MICHAYFFGFLGFNLVLKERLLGCHILLSNPLICFLPLNTNLFLLKKFKADLSCLDLYYATQIVSLKLMTYEEVCLFLLKNIPAAHGSPSHLILHL